MDEDVVIGFGILLVLAIPVAVIGLVLWAVRQSRRMRELEGNLRLLEAQIEKLSRASTSPLETVAETPLEPEPETGSHKEDKEPASASAAKGPWQATVKKSDEGEEAPAEPPTQEPTPEPPAATEPEYAPPQAVVFRRDRMAELGQWLQLNWIYVVSAVSLATAGIFLVQYGIENGYLTPRARVWAALAFGTVLVTVGEYLRRRWGDEGDVATAYLPSIFSSAGIVTLFAAILAARHLYQMIESGTALVGLVAIALLAVVLGWFSGPLLAAVGIIGAMAAPFAVGGESDAPELFFGYFGVVALAGLMIDAMRRWAWVSVLSLGTGFGAAWFLYLGIGKGEWLMALYAALALGAIAIPVKTLAPAHNGTAFIDTLRRERPKAWPEFPTNLAAGTLLFAVFGITLVSLDGVAEFWLSTAILSLLFAALSLWSWRAHALEDLATLPALGVVALPYLQVTSPYLQVTSGGDVLRAFREVLPLGPEDTIPYDPIMLAGAALVVSLLAAQRSFLGPRWPVAWAAGAAITAPLMMVELEAYWRPADVIGAYTWALTAAAIAMVMGVLAERFARADGAPGIRTALVTLAALLMICFALMVMLSETALTLALTATVLAAAALDRRFDISPLLWFVKVGGIAVSWRLVIDPGLGWAEDAPYWELFAAYAGVIAVLLATLAVLRTRDRAAATVVTESVAGAIAAVFASVLVYRLIVDFAPTASEDSHWAVSLIGLVWVISAANLIWRLQIGGPLKWVRKILIVIYLLLGSTFLGVAVTLFNPLSSGDVLGPVVINTLFVAYLLPATLFAFMALKFIHISYHWRLVLIVAASAFAALWLGLDIRHFWRGPDLSVPGTTQPELYTYTVAMLVVGAGLLYQAIASGSSTLRRVAMSVIALTVAKVFLIDASGLTGLTRVFSFLALGLSLAGLAFLNRWAAGQELKRAEDTVEPTE